MSQSNSFNAVLKQVNSQTFNGTNVIQYWTPAANRSIYDGGQSYNTALISTFCRSVLLISSNTTLCGYATCVADYHLTSAGVLTLINARDITYSGLINSVTPAVYSNQAIQITFGTRVSGVGCVVSYMEIVRSHFLSA